MTGEPRWFSETEEGHSQEYAASLHQMALDGQDLEGEARLLDAIIAPGARVLDAGCGQGRIAAATWSLVWISIRSSCPKRSR